MLFNKLKKLPVLQMTFLLLIMASAIIVGACPGDEVGGTDPNPVAGDFNISGLAVVYDGQPKAVTITPKADKSTGTITVYYNGSATAPSALGSYPVTFDVAAASGWNEVKGLYAGILNIQETLDPDTNYISGSSALSWGIETTPLTLGLMPGKDTTEINLNWYSTGAAAGKVAQVRFARGTFAKAYELIEKTGTASALSNSATTHTAHKATVTGLKPGASYQYAVSSDGTNWSPVYSFKVPAATGAFKFAVIADPQLHLSTWDPLNRYDPAGGKTTGEGWIETMRKIVAAGVSFIASGGDQVDTTNNGSEAEYTLFFAPPGLRTLPIAPVSGNHDAHVIFNDHYNLPNVQADGGTGTETGRNYFYLYNNILFVVLDTAPYPNSTSAAAPYVQRHRDTLTAAKAAHPAGTYDWLIVQHHKSTASVADHLADRDIQYYVEAGFEKAMSDFNVDFVLAGHDHVYARSYPLSGRDGGLVSVPDKTFSAASGSTWTNPGNPIYLTYTTGSGLKYYAVRNDPTSVYNNTLYVKDNVAYPYLGEIATGDTSTNFGSADYLTGNYMPVSNAAYVQPYVPSYCIAEVNGKTIKFSTYAIATVSGQVTGAAEAYSFNADVPYDSITVTKTN